MGLGGVGNTDGRGPAKADPPKVDKPKEHEAQKPPSKPEPKKADAAEGAAAVGAPPKPADAPSKDAATGAEPRGPVSTSAPETSSSGPSSSDDGATSVAPAGVPGMTAPTHLDDTEGVPTQTGGSPTPDDNSPGKKAPVPGKEPEPHGPVSTSEPAPALISQDELDELTLGAGAPKLNLHGDVPVDAAAESVRLLGQVPESASDIVAAEDVTGTLFDGPLTEVPGFEHLAGREVAKYGTGEPWDTVPGIGGGSSNDVDFAADPSREEPGSGHGSDSLVLHEFAHALDREAQNPPAWKFWGDEAESDTSGWSEGPQAEIASSDESAYLRDHADEWFAESFARYTRSPEQNAELQDEHPTTYGYLVDRFGSPRFG